MKRVISIIAVALICLTAVAQEQRTWCKKVFVSSEGLELPYCILYPKNFNPEQSYPMLVMLHGSGERGNDNEAQLIHGGKLLSTSEELYDVITIVPQCPNDSIWAMSKNWKNVMSNEKETGAGLAVMELLREFIGLGFADPDRVYGTGLSMGGIGILDLAMTYPDFFAAVQPICGSFNIRRAQTYKGKTAFRFFHGTNDKAVDPQASIKGSKILADSQTESVLVLYPGVAHGSWYNAFAEPDFLSWMLSRTRKTKSKK